jgi:chaperonin GroES
MAKLKITLPADRVLIEPAPAEEKTAAGIIIPDTAKEKPQKGTVIAVGTGKQSYEILDLKITSTDKKGNKKEESKISLFGEDIINIIGTIKKDEPMNVKVGDKVLYGKYAGTELTIDGSNYLIMRESDIVAIV